MFPFELLHEHSGGRARRGRLHTPHGPLDTPAFMPVGTRGTIKGLTPDQVAASGAQMILANTYHLFLRPGAEQVVRWGGLHRFMAWDGPILTDSGGFQVFSLASLARIETAGITFQSHIDGARLFLDPATAMRVQNCLGADVIMALDHCPPYPSPIDQVAQAVENTLAWGRACRDLHHSGRQDLFGIVQGGIHRDLRVECAQRLCEMGFDGYAIGGLSVGEPHELMVEVLDYLPEHLPPGRPRYLMGVGMPRDLFAAVRRGVDMFDCVLPTRNGRNAYAFTAAGPLKLRNLRHRDSAEPIESCCDCYACSRFSRGYIRHLFLVDEMLGPILTSIHNLRFYQRFMARMRSLIEEDRLDTILDEFPVARAAGESECAP